LIADDAIQIGTNAGAPAVVGIAGAENLEEAFLNDIFGVGGGVGEAVGEAEESRVVVVEELEERPFAHLNTITAKGGKESARGKNTLWPWVGPTIIEKRAYRKVDPRAAILTRQDVFPFEKTGVTDTGKVVGRFRATGFRPKFYDRRKTSGITLPPTLFQTIGEIT